MTALSEYRKQGSKRLLDDASTGSQMPPRVSINGNKFTLFDPAGNATPVPFLKDGAALDIVFTDRNEKMSKLFWGEGNTYNPAETGPPLCFSDNGVAPSTQSQEVQSALCATCRWNAIGSAISQVSGAKIKACGDLKKFAVVVRGFPGVYLFTVKPGSFKAWNNYTNFLKMQKLPEGGQPDLSDVVTRVRFTGQGIMSFEAIERVTDEHEMAEQVVDVWEHNKINDITGMMIGRYDQPSSQGRLAAPAIGEGQPATLPPPQQGQGNIFGTPAAETEKAKPKARPKKPEETRAEVQPAQPVAPAQQGSPPSDISARLESLFKLPLV